MLHDALERDEIGGLAVRLDDRDLDEPRLDLHEGVREALEAVPRHGAHAAQRAAELVRGEFVEDPEALVIVLRARDERIDLRPGIDVRVGIGAGRGLEHEFLPTVLGRGRTERRHPDPDDPDAHVRPSPAGPFAGNPRPHKRLSHAPCSQRP